ncbi:uncharacterized protein JCM6883_006235 [Sporobolomyces salmoneus]|uniref:uncharacterized protein n=1 Tax=Sporobolomyces salmoneus TaxID=183962 RepID=UPI00317D4B50
MAANNRWAARKGGSFVARDALSIEQQQILAAVPRWKREWVRPTNLQPGQSPNFKILKWVIDTSADKSSGTVEEMEAAVEQVTQGNVPISNGDSLSERPSQPPGSNGSTPAPSLTIPNPTEQVSAARLENSSNVLREVMQTNSAQTPATETTQTVEEAVQPLLNVPSKGLIDGGDATGQKDKSLMEE